MVVVRVNKAFLVMFVADFVMFNFLGVFNKTIIPLALVGYEIVIANSAAPRWLSTISYPTRARGIIVKYTTRKRCITSIYCCRRVIFLRRYVHQFFSRSKSPGIRVTGFPRWHLAIATTSL